MTPWQQIENNLSETLGERITLSRPDSVSGGCINQAYRAQSAQQKFFIKMNDETGLEMFEAEAEGLNALGKADGLRIPKPICSGMAEGHAWLVMEDLQIGSTGNQAALGEGLAAMHRITADKFGWHRDNTIGATPQINQQETDWVHFWQEHRLGYQLQLAIRRGAGSKLQAMGEQLLDALPKILADHSPQASLLHGDLWSGNYAFTQKAEPTIFDPAVYYGDREADLAMTELFGGFGSEFYAAYENAWPLDKGYSSRKKLYNLYHVLNHYNLFGGGYLSQAKGVMTSLLREV
ncbi:MAG: fructosamine kinase family protein [Gammaproteobacteria bacterium]